MSYPVQNNAPQVTINGRTFVVGSFLFPTPIGNMYEIGIFEKDPIQGWCIVLKIGEYVNSGDLLKAVQVKGGMINYIQWVISQVNSFFTKLFTTTVIITSEPTTDDEALTQLTSTINSLSFSIINGIPILK